ncbi:MAG: hypothetical protein OXF67_03305, partial [Cyanobacteria bacterium MAG CAR4_bin_6]|nr:hypothetical protein [Cyanobacteria bacterium MAG CAR4_bin_6]
TDSSKDQLLEIYKLHAELADRVSQRREGANRLHVSLLSGFLVFLAALLRFGSGEIPTSVLLLFSGIIGMAISGSWCFMIGSYQQLNKGKLNTLQELEQKLAYSFFTREWELLGWGRNPNRYRKVTSVEKILPSIFFLLFFSFLVIALCML